MTRMSENFVTEIKSSTKKYFSHTFNTKTVNHHKKKLAMLQEHIKEKGL